MSYTKSSVTPPSDSRPTYPVVAPWSPHLAQDWVVNCRGHSQAQEEAGATVHRGRKVSASLFSFWRSLQGRAVPAAQAAEREGGSEPGLVQGTPGVEVREQISRLGVGRSSRIRALDSGIQTTIYKIDEQQ